MRAITAALLVALVALLSPVSARAGSGPALETPEAELAAALDCPDEFSDPVHQPLLLVHGTFTNGWEHWGWNWQLAEGWDVCVVTLPGRSMGDMQVQAEYVVYAIREIAARSGEKVDVVGHSQGALHPRWVIKWWPDVAASVDDLVMLAGPNHGTGLAATNAQGCFAACWQMAPGSNYLRVLNAGDETPGSISYTSIYSLSDELVQPQFPQSTSALDGAVNVLIQDVCPGRPVDHAFMMVDHAVHAVMLDALTHPGPADRARLDPVTTCAGVWMDGVDPVGHGPGILQRDAEAGFPGFGNVPAEPPLKSYAAQPDDALPTTTGQTGGQPGGQGQGGGSAGRPSAVAAASATAGAGGTATPATGGILSPATGIALMVPALVTLLRQRRKEN